VAAASPESFHRWWIVVGALLIQLCLGAIYAWSVFRKPLETSLNITPTQASLPFSFVLIFFSVAMVFGGRLQDRLGPRIVALTGGVLLASGMLIASFASDIVSLVLAYGGLSGIGIGLAYVCPISAGIKWFPDKRGLITGLTVFGFGAGAFIVGPVARALIDSVGVSNTFRSLGLAYLVLIFLGALLLRNPPPDYRPTGWTPSLTTVLTQTHFTVAQMLSSPRFYLIWVLYFTGAGFGLMMIGQTSPIAQELGGYSKETAALGVSVLALFNAFGRVFWGRLSDTLGRATTLLLMYLINAFAVFGYLLIPTAPALFWVGIALVGASFGGYLALYPAITADLFGTKHIGLNYGFVFTAYGVGGLLSNIFAPRVKELTGTYDFAFILAGILLLASAAGPLLLKTTRPR
jgi:OFA family oxalate/formate antiporter-like MFS transporter